LFILFKAAQCLEVECLIPLRFGCNRIIQVGDPEQLPATIFSKLAQDCKFNQSLFERFYQRFRFDERNPINMLYVQYRMHPEICAFPSENFYKGKLRTHEDLKAKFVAQSKLKPYFVYDIKESKEIGDENGG